MNHLLYRMNDPFIFRLFSVSLYMMGYPKKKNKKNKQEEHALSLFAGSKDQGIYVELRASRLSHFNTFRVSTKCTY